MRDRFLSMGEWLRPVIAEETIIEPFAELEEAAGESATSEAHVAGVDEAIADVRRFRAALADALDVALETLLNDIACDVLCRELQLKPVDLQAIVERAKERFLFDDPVSIRIHPEELETIDDGQAKLVADSTLRRGDVVLEVRSGTIDATLGARLESVLAARSVQ